MLALKQAISLVSLKNMGWSPVDESSLVAWYRKGVGITLSGSDVQSWDDSSGNGHTMVQLTASEMPTYYIPTGNLSFVNADINNLQTSSQISLAGQFTVGIRFYPTAFNNVVIGDNTADGELFKLTASDRLRIKVYNSATVDLDLDRGSFGNDYLVITRDGSNVCAFSQNGTLQADTGALSGTIDIDAIGVRKTDLNAYTGGIKEIQIYSSTSAALTANVNNRLASI